MGKVKSLVTELGEDGFQKYLEQCKDRTKRKYKKRIVVNIRRKK